MSILEFLGLGRGGDDPQGSAGQAETQTVRKIVERLERMPPEEARFIAAFAFMLSRVARADLDISPEETQVMERMVMEYGGLLEEQAIIVVQITKSQNLLFGGTENYLVSREFNRMTSREQKLALLSCLFAVSAADQSISGIEDQVIRQIARELRLEHADFIEARSRFRDHLSVLKPRPPARDDG